MAAPIVSSCLKYAASSGSLNRVAIRTAVTFNPQNDHFKLLVVGTGTGGLAVATPFARKLGAGNVAIMDNAEKHYYQAGFTLVGGGIKTLDEVTRKTKDLIPKKAKWIEDRAAKFDPANNKVLTEDGEIYTYDYLVIATGVKLRFDLIKGAEEALKNRDNVCSNYCPETVQKTYKNFQKFKGGNALFTFPAWPIKCAGAPQKIMWIFEHYCRKNNLRDKANILFNTALPKMFGIQHYSDALFKMTKERNIHPNFRHNLVEVRGDKQEAVFDILNEDGKPIKQTTVNYDFIHIGAPCQPVPALKSAPQDLVDGVGFVTVDKDTLQHTKYKNVFAIGDCNNAPTSKTAAAVAGQAGVIQKNLHAVMNGQKPTAVYDGYTSCPLVTSYNTVMLAEFDYSLQPLETLPVDQRKNRYTAFLMKNKLMPFLYWNGLIRGTWSGPKWIRKLMHLGFGK